MVEVPGNRVTPLTWNDLLPWYIYDNIRGSFLYVPIIFCNSNHRPAKAAWHTTPESVYPHTKRLLKHILVIIFY